MRKSVGKRVRYDSARYQSVLHFAYLCTLTLWIEAIIIMFLEKAKLLILSRSSWMRFSPFFDMTLIVHFSWTFISAPFLIFTWEFIEVCQCSLRSICHVITKPWSTYTTYFFFPLAFYEHKTCHFNLVHPPNSLLVDDYVVGCWRNTRFVDDQTD